MTHKRITHYYDRIINIGRYLIILMIALCIYILYICNNIIIYVNCTFLFVICTRAMLDIIIYII